MRALLELDENYNVIENTLKTINLEDNYWRSSTDDEFHYFPEWNGVFLRSTGSGTNGAPSPDPETVIDTLNYDLNPDSLIRYDVELSKHKNGEY